MLIQVTSPGQVVDHKVSIEMVSHQVGIFLRAFLSEWV
jgi:hypothetical protein